MAVVAAAAACEEATAATAAVICVEMLAILGESLHRELVGRAVGEQGAMCGEEVGTVDG